MCDPPGVEPDDISEANSHHSFAICVVLKINKTLKISQLIILSMKILKLDLKLHTVAKIMNLLYQEAVYFVKLHLYWLENFMIFTGPSQKNTFSEFLCFNQSHFISITLS